MREAIRKVYDSESWSIKVDRMYDDQVIAIYLKFEKEGKLKPQPDIYPKRPFKQPKAVQLSFEDYLRG
jgi:hypothetical protein